MAFHPVIASFVGNTTWFGILIGLHMAGAIVGLGPTFAFGLMGGMMKKNPGPSALTILEVLDKIEHAIVTPVLLAIQLTTGILLIVNRGLQHRLFKSNGLWLLAGIIVYIAAMTIAIGVDGPARKKTMAMAKEGKMADPEFGKLVALQMKLGPILGILGTTIVILMIWKPGSGCSPPNRC